MLRFYFDLGGVFHTESHGLVGLIGSVAHSQHYRKGGSNVNIIVLGKSHFLVWFWCLFQVRAYVVCVCRNIGRFCMIVFLCVSAKSQIIGLLSPCPLPSQYEFSVKIVLTTKEHTRSVLEKTGWALPSGIPGPERKAVNSSHIELKSW